MSHIIHKLILLFYFCIVNTILTVQKLHPMNKKTSSTFVVALLGLALFSMTPQTAVAQAKTSTKQPAWITKAPTVKNTYVGIASVSKRSMNPDGEAAENPSVVPTSSIIVSQLFFNDKYKESGKKEAQKKILGSLRLSVDANSLLGQLILKGEYSSSFDDVFIDQVLDTPLLKLQGEWEDDDEYWCYYSITEKDYQQRITSFEDSICRQAQTIWEVGMSYQEEGMLYNAAKTYTDALNMVHPLIYTQHPIKHDFETVDLFTSIYNSYIHVYDDLKLTSSIDVIPAVAGEGVPASFTIKVDQRGVPVKKVGLQVNYDGTVDGALITDDNGTVTFQLAKATDEPIQNITFSLDKDGLFDLPESYAFKQLTAKAETFGTADVGIKLFDPTNYIYIEVNPSDSATDKAVREIVAARKDLTIVTDKSKADLILSTALATRMEQESVSAEKWAISKYSSSLEISVKPVQADEELFHYSIDEFQYLVPATLKKDQVLHSSAKEMSRQVTREFADKFKPFSYDKRQIVWSKLK